MPSGSLRPRCAAMKPAIFLDRDGTLNVEKHYLYRQEDWEWIPGAREAIKAFNDAGWYVVIVTNQAGIAHGYYSEADLTRLNGFIRDQLAQIGAHVDLYLHCPHHPDETGPCACRKPSPGMLRMACAALPIDSRRSYLLGDRVTDLDAARALGVTPVLVRTGYGETEAPHAGDARIVPSIAEAVRLILPGA